MHLLIRLFNSNSCHQGLFAVVVLLASCSFCVDLWSLFSVLCCLPSCLGGEGLSRFLKVTNLVTAYPPLDPPAPSPAWLSLA